MNLHENILKTAQFAKLCNVSKQTLIYYDKIGIFSPHYIDEKGYRYYSLSQHEPFKVISMLRELGTPLKEIQEYLENKNPTSFLELLEKKQQEVMTKINNLKKISQLIDERKNMTKEGISIDNYDNIMTLRLPEEKITISQYVKNEDYYEHLQLISNLEKYVAENNGKSLYIGGMIEKNKLLSNEFQKVTYFYIKSDTINKNTIVKPKGLYAIAYHKGSFDTIELAYKKVVDYIKQNNYAIIGNSYEDTLLDFCTQNSEEEQVIKISIQIEKLQNNLTKGL